MTITTCIFDAYGTLFDVDAAARTVANEPGQAQLAAVWGTLSKDWRTKQLEYAWLRAIGGRHIPFWQVTQDALDWALENNGLADNALRAKLLSVYKDLPAFPEVPAMLKAIKDKGMNVAILSNGSPDMLVNAVRSAGIGEYLDDVLSVEEVQIYKPHRQVYDLVWERFDVPQSEVLFASANGWDAAGAAGYGFSTVWINRTGAPQDRLWADPHRILPDLSKIPDLVLMADFTTPDGTRLFYTDAGEGLPVLALTGLTRNTGDFDHVAPHLPVRLIRMDYRGRGQSDWADFNTYTIPQEAADAVALLDHLNIEKAAILGTSRGGLIAMLLAATAKHRLLGVALNDIGPEIADAGMSVIMDYIGRNPAQPTHTEAAEFRAKAWSHFKGVPMGRWLHEVRNHYDETPDGLVIKYDPHLRDAVLAGRDAPVPDLWPLFDALAGLPLAILRGDASDLLSAPTFEAMRNRRPDAHAATVLGRGHVPFLDEPEALGVLHDWILSL